MTEIVIREATLQDVDFVIETIVQAEKGNGERISYCSLFNISETEFRYFLRNVLHEEMNYFEFGLKSFKVAFANNIPIAAYAAWIENIHGFSSGILKASAFKAFLKRESLLHYEKTAHITEEISFKRQPNTIQFESMYIDKNHRGKNIGNLLVQQLIGDLLKKHPNITTAHLQLIKQNTVSLNWQLRHGFEIIDEKTTDNKEIFQFYPGNTKVLLEKNYRL